jgi:hypothetical protein
VNETTFEIDSEALAAMMALPASSDNGVDKPEHVSRSSWTGRMRERVEDEAEFVMKDLIFSLDELGFSSFSSETVGSESGVISLEEDLSVESFFRWESRRLLERRNRRRVSIRERISSSREEPDQDRSRKAKTTMNRTLFVLTLR